jgi:hypothetical protein
MPREFTIGEGFGAAFEGLNRAYANYKTFQQQEIENRRADEVLKLQQASDQRAQELHEPTLAGAKTDVEKQKLLLADTQRSLDVQHRLAQQALDRGDTEQDLLELDYDRALRTLPDEVRTSALNLEALEIDVGTKREIQQHVKDAAMWDAMLKKHQATFGTGLTGDALDKWLQRESELDRRHKESQAFVNEQLGNLHKVTAEAKQAEMEFLQNQAVEDAEAVANSGFPAWRRPQAVGPDGKPLFDRDGNPIWGDAGLEAGQARPAGWSDQKNASNNAQARYDRIQERINPSFYETTATREIKADTGWTDGDIAEQIAAFAMRQNSENPVYYQHMLATSRFIDVLESGDEDRIKGLVPEGQHGMTKAAREALKQFFGVEEDGQGKYAGLPTTMLQIPLEVYEAAGFVPSEWKALGFNSDQMVNQIGDYRRDVEWDILEWKKMGAKDADIVAVLGNTLAWMQDNPTEAQKLSIPANTDVSRFMGPSAPVAGVEEGSVHVPSLRSLAGLGSYSPATDAEMAQTSMRNIRGQQVMQGGGIAAHLPFTSDLGTGLDAHANFKAMRQDIAKQRLREGKVSPTGTVDVGGASSPFLFLRAMRAAQKKANVFNHYPAKLKIGQKY